MTTKDVRDFLDKEIFVKRNIVTFRSLSRELGIHVNDAKNQLQHYYDAVRNTETPAVPTYLVSGEVPSLTILRSDTQQSDTMDIDLEFEEDRVEMDVIHQSKVLLVDARTLDETKLQFSRLYSVHIYSLSPSRLGDAGFICTPSFKVHQADAQGGIASFSVSGKITGPHVKRRAGVVHQSTASSSKRTLDVPAKATARAVVPEKAEQQTTKGQAPSLDAKAQASATTTLLKPEPRDWPKPSGKLDWSKAKTKGKEPVAGKTREEKKSKLEPDSTIAAKDPLVSKKPGLELTKPSISKPGPGSVASVDAQKRGIKRKPQEDVVSEFESESESEPFLVKVNQSTTGSSVKGGLVYSEEDDDGEVRMLGRRRPKRKSTMTSDSEMSLRAMMDIDDEQVDHVSRVGYAYARREESEESEEERKEPEKEVAVPPVTSEDEESDHMPVIPKRRKPRKVIPVGRNGLKKRRVIKSRTTTDTKGYMQTEDYSSYESVEEEEAETKPKGKGKGRETKKTSEPKVEAKPKVVVKEESVGKLQTKSAPKPKGGATNRGGLLNFFGPERGKK